MLKKILVVDDETGFTDALSDVFTARGYAVTAAHDGEEALEKMRGDRPDLVILDIMMPKMDGLKVAATLRSDNVLKDVPVVMLTARTEVGDTKQGLELGAAAYVAKPFRMESLLGIVDGLIGQAAA